MNQPYARVNKPYAMLTLASALREIFGVQLYKNNARALLSRILSILNLDWLQHARTVRVVYEITMKHAVSHMKIHHVWDCTISVISQCIKPYVQFCWLQILLNILLPTYHPGSLSMWWHLPIDDLYHAIEWITWPLAAVPSLQPGDELWCRLGKSLFSCKQDKYTTNEALYQAENFILHWEWTWCHYCVLMLGRTETCALLSVCRKIRVQLQKSAEMLARM